MERTIKVTGKGKLAVKPDLIRLTLNLEDTQKKYEDVVSQSAKQVEKLKDCFEQVGFSRTDLKTLTYNISTEYETYHDIKNNWKRRMVGYKCVHAMKIEFDANNQLLSKILTALAHCCVKPEFHIVYTIKDVEMAKNQLLGNAVADSKEKAKVLAQAAGVQLGEIQNIDYSWDEITFVSKPMKRCLPVENARSMEASSVAVDIEPDNIEVTDTVTILWSIS